MLYAFIISAVLLLIGVLAMGFRIFFIKDGVFPNIHIGGNKGLKEKGVHCATTQDRDAQKTNKLKINSELIEQLTKSID